MNTLLTRISIALALAVVVCAAVPPSAAANSPVVWEKYQARKYGFSMLVPVGIRLKEKQFGPRWGELTAKYGVVTLVALAKLGDKATPDEIERVGVKITNIPAAEWRVIGRGRNEGGWLWWKTVTAERNGMRIIGDYGAGNKSSYLMLLITTEDDFRSDQANYKRWYQSIQLN